ncbi:TrgA family protein [Arenibacterium sp. CAU 1754]
MPDAARLFAALGLAITAFIISGQIIPLMPEGLDFGYFTYVNMAIGAITGWIVMGKRAGRGVTAAINNGITGAVAMVFWGLFVQGCWEMFDLAMRNRYDGPFEAVMAIFQIAAGYGMTMFVPNIIITLAVGGVATGLATEYAWRNWR